MYHIFGCPMHFGVGDKGLTYSLDYLNDYCKDLNITMLPEITMPEYNLKNLKNLNSVIATCEQIAEEGYAAIKNGETPLFIAGDHSSVIGTISASSACHENLGLIWIDAHPDINTDATTVTGNIHGMPVAALLGMGEQKLTQILTPEQKIKAENIVMIGLRDIDPPEAEFLEQLHIKHYTYDQVIEQGLESCLNETISYLSHLKHIHISFDIDVMNPDIMPGVSVPVPDGFNEEEAFYIMNRLVNELPIASYDIVEYNAEHDIDDKTAEFTKRLAHFILEH